MSGVLSNDTDVDGDALTADLVATTANGTLTLNADGSFEYTPTADYHGPDSFTYQANDTQDLSAVITINITVNSVNDAPVAVADSALDEDTTLNIAAPGVLANDTDTEGDALTVMLVTDVTNGTLVLNGDGSLDTPNADFNGADRYYKVNDGDDSNIVTVDLTIDPVNDAPVAQADSYAVDEDNVLTRDGSAGLEGGFNDSDVEGDNLVSLIGDVSNGTTSP